MSVEIKTSTHRFEAYDLVSSEWVNFEDGDVFAFLELIQIYDHSSCLWLVITKKGLAKIFTDIEGNSWK